MESISPLFAVDVEELINSRDYLSAAELCKTGLKQYPDYNTAKKLLAVALKHIGNIEEANEVINSISSFAKTTKQLKKTFEVEVEQIIAGTTVVITESADEDDLNIDDLISDFNQDEEVVAIEEPSNETDDDVIAYEESSNETDDDVIANEDKIETNSEQENQAKLISKLYELNKLTRYNTDYDTLESVPGMNFIYTKDNLLLDLPNINKAKSLMDELDDLASKLIGGNNPIKRFDEENDDDNYQHRAEMVSETLAKIYTVQGAYQAAIDIYDKLIIKEPDKIKKYQKKIKKLKNMLK